MHTAQIREARTPRSPSVEHPISQPAPQVKRRARKTLKKRDRRALLAAGDCALLLIDYQPFQFAGLRSHETEWVIDNAIGLTTAARAFGVPTLLSTVAAGRVGHLIQPLQAIFPEQKPIDRRTINAWRDDRVLSWVKKTGRERLIMAGLWTEICLALPTLEAISDGYEVLIVTDASGSVSLQAPELWIQRMVQAGAVPITWGAVARQRQPDVAGEAARLQQAFAEILEDFADPFEAANDDFTRSLHIESGRLPGPAELRLSAFTAVADSGTARADGAPGGRHVDLHIHLGENTTRSDCDAIFASIAAHLYGR